MYLYVYYIDEFHNNYINRCCRYLRRRPRRCCCFRLFKVLLEEYFFTTPKLTDLVCSTIVLDIIMRDFVNPKMKLERSRFTEKKYIK